MCSLPDGGQSDRKGGGGVGGRVVGEARGEELIPLWTDDGNTCQCFEPLILLLLLRGHTDGPWAPAGQLNMQVA